MRGAELVLRDYQAVTGVTVNGGGARVADAARRRHEGGERDGHAAHSRAAHRPLGGRRISVRLAHAAGFHRPVRARWRTDTPTSGHIPDGSLATTVDRAVSVVSDPGRGSPGTRERARRSRVLIAEDDESLRTLLRLSIDVGELDIDEAVDGEAALELARRNPPDVVLLDWMMPGVSGLDVCRALRADPRTASALIVIVTARSRAGDRDAALAAGADQYVAKPFSPVALLEAVRHVL